VERQDRQPAAGNRQTKKGRQPGCLFHERLARRAQIFRFRAPSAVCRLPSAAYRRVGALALAVCCVAGVPAAAQTLTGRIEWKTRGGAQPAQAVVYAEPLDRPASSSPGKATFRQKNKTFLPHVVAVPVGSTVTFPNDDAIFHNVFSLSPPQPFDLGLYRAGATKQQVFAKPGVHHVFCNIHPQMAAFLVVAPTPYVTVAGQDGTWRLDVPPGKYRVTALSERASPVLVEVAVSGAATTVDGLVLDESAFLSAPHTNKFGKPYPKDAYKP
jgi:plastocyanin